jgi:uncharacterized protein YndB with AHSA1/START domain
MDPDRHLASVERIIAAPAARIFDVLADPSRHRDIDGSGSVREAAAGSPARLHLGAVFGMRMKQGAGYTMDNEVVEFEEGRRIAWTPKARSKVIALFGGGRIWRYELEPQGDGSSTLVRETWDMRQEALRFLLRPLRGSTIKAMATTLERLDALVTSAPA